MENQQRKINLEPIYTFFREDIYPKEFAELLDEFLYHYVLLLVQAVKDDKTTIHEEAVEFIHYLRYYGIFCLYVRKSNHYIIVSDIDSEAFFII